MKNKKYLPQSVAGLLSYYEEKKTLIKFKPETVIAIILGVSAIVLALHMV